MGFDLHTVSLNRLRLGLPKNTRTRPIQHPTERDYAPPKDKPNPVAVAFHWLGMRLVEKPSGFWLDGRPASLDTVMRETNAVLKREGVDQIGVEKWRVK